MTKKNLAVIGGGVISAHYLAALRDSEAYRLVAMCDINPDCVSRKLYSHVPFYDDYKKLMSDININTAIISTPPAGHFEIACELLSSGVNVFLEKPMCTDFESIEKLYALASQKKKELICLLHWRYADEVRFLCQYVKDKKIKKIKTRICDNYCVPGTLDIKQKCLNLLGGWYDSGVNALSYMDLLIGIEDAVLKSSESIKDPNNGFPVYVKKVYLCGDVELEIEVDWRYDTRGKTSVITFEDGELFVSHTDQKVTRNNEVIFSLSAEKRLENHYINLFGSKTFKEDNEAVTKRVHRILFKENL